MERPVARSFRLNIRVLKFIGLYPPEKYHRCYKIYSLTLYILAMIPSGVFGTLHFVLTREFVNMNYNDFIVIGMAFYTFKLLPFVKHGDRIKKCMQYFDQSCYKVVKNEYKKVIEECIRICRRNSMIFFMGCISALIECLGEIFLVGNLNQLPLAVWVPKGIMSRATLYYILYALLLLGIVYSVLACGTIDPLIGGLAHHAAVQLQLLKKNLQHLDMHVDQEIFDFKKKCEIDRSERIYSEIKKCIRKYQAIANFVNEYEACFSPVVFTQFMGSGVVIGFCCFQMSKMSPTDVNFLIMFNYLAVMLFQIFFYCYYGTLLIEENNSLSSAIYMSRWYEYDTKSKKSLIVLMERSKKPMVVTAGKLLDLSLETFTMILKRAYSLLAVLRNYQG